MLCHCAWCGQILRQAVPGESHAVNHGICLPCAEETLICLACAKDAAFNAPQGDGRTLEPSTLLSAAAN
jgi:hypothetical protein